MAGTETAILGFAGLGLLLLLRVPVGLALLLAGTVGIALIRPAAALPTLAGEVFAVASKQSLTILPLFILMGHLAVVSGMGRDLYAAANSWLGHLRGGLASASIVGCAGFSALSGSSLASALTIGRVSLGEMRRYGYDDSLATGAVAAGGTLGILIPPSVGLVIYAVLTEASIGRLFAAGILPGLLLTTLFVLAVWVVVKRAPDKAPRMHESRPWRARWRALARAGWTVAVIGAMMVGLYMGAFSAIEAAGVGAFLAFATLVVRRRLNWRNVVDVCAGTLRATGTAFLILCGAFVFKTFIGFTEAMVALAGWIGEQGLSGVQIALATLLLFIAVGTFLEGFAILVLAVPLLLPILAAADVDLIWFGVLVVVTLEMGLISPPVGINVFVVKGIAEDVPLAAVFRGIWPFWLAMLGAIALIVAVPQIATLLPDALYGSR